MDADGVRVALEREGDRVIAFEWEGERLEREGVLGGMFASLCAFRLFMVALAALVGFQGGKTVCLRSVSKYLNVGRRISNYLSGKIGSVSWAYVL